MSNWFRKKSPTILTCVGVVGVVATAISAVHATPKAMELLDEAEKDSDKELDVVDKIRVAGPVYIPTIAIGASTVACICGIHLLDQRQQASIMSAYGMLDAGYKKYRGKLKEIYGKDADKTVQNEMSKDKYRENPPSKPSEGKLLWYEPYRDEFFELSEKEVIDAEYQLNRTFVLRGEVNLNDFYEFLGLDPIDIGDEIGWEITDDGRVFDKTWIDFEHHFIVPNNNEEAEYYRIEIVPPSGVLALDECI